MKKFLLALNLVTISIINCAEQYPNNLPGGPGINDMEFQVVRPIENKEQSNQDKCNFHYSLLESKHSSMINDIKNEFISKIKNLNLSDKQVIKKFISAYIDSLDELLILQRSTNLDYNFIKSNFAHVFDKKQKELVKVLNNNNSLYPIIKKLSVDTKTVIDLIPDKVYSVFQNIVKDNPKTVFDYLKKMYVSIHIEVMGLIACDLLKKEDLKAFTNFLKWYEDCNFYYLRNDQVFSKILQILQIQKVRYCKALENNKIEKQQKFDTKLDGLLSKEFANKILLNLQSKVDAVSADYYKNSIAMLWATPEDKLKAQKNVWQAKLEFYDFVEKLLRFLINSHNIQSKL